MEQDRWASRRLALVLACSCLVDAVQLAPGGPSDAAAPSAGPMEVAASPAEERQISSMILDAVGRMPKGRAAGGSCEGGWEKGPVVIGGLSSSGTRGARWIVHDRLGIKMSPNIVKWNGDDKKITFVIGLVWRGLLSHVRGEISNASFSDAGKYLNHARSLICAAVKQSWDEAGKPTNSWGFKTPRAITMVPLLDEMFGGSWTFIHVVRDPRTTCRKLATKVQFATVCKNILSEEECQYPAGCFRYWAAVNGDVHRYFSKAGGRSELYIPLPMERLVLPQPVVGSESFSFFKHFKQRFRGWMPRKQILDLLAEEHRFVPEYSRSHMLGSEVDMLEEVLQNLTQSETRVREAVQGFGYNSTSTGIVDNWWNLFY